jgi:hypothetical protein
MTSQMGLFDGRRLRDEGCAVVLDPETEWRTAYDRIVKNWFKNLPEGTCFSADDLREQVEISSLDEPHHPNCWSAASKAFLTDMRQMQRIRETLPGQSNRPSRHAAMTRRYIKTW